MQVKYATRWPHGQCASGLGSSSPASNPGLGYCVMFLGKTLYSCSVSLHSGTQMGTGGFNTGDHVTAVPGLSSHTEGGGRCRKVDSCDVNRDKLRPGGPLG